MFTPLYFLLVEETDIEQRVNRGDFLLGWFKDVHVIGWPAVFLVMSLVGSFPQSLFCFKGHPEFCYGVGLMLKQFINMSFPSPINISNQNVWVGSLQKPSCSQGMGTCYLKMMTMLGPGESLPNLFATLLGQASRMSVSIAGFLSSLGTGHCFFHSHVPACWVWPCRFPAFNRSAVILNECKRNGRSLKSHSGVLRKLCYEKM